MSRDLMKKFASANLVEMLGMIRCGFELEFQALDGKRKDDCVEYDFDEVDYDLLREDADEAMVEVSIQSIAGSLPSDIKAFVISLDDNSNITWSEIREACQTLPAIAEALEKAEQSWRDMWMEHALHDDPGRYCPRIEPYSDVGLPDNVELVDDGSVRGGELRTEGALTADQFLKALKETCKLDLTVDTGCSFHVHLSIDGIRHGYGKNLQFYMMQYLVENFQLWPESVKRRIDKTRYYKLEVSRDKYSMINFHPQKTWEFRIFGNVTDPLDGYRCLILACRAMQYAYRQILADKDSAYSQIVDLNIETEQVLMEVISFNSTVDYVLRKRGRNSRVIEAA